VQVVVAGGGAAPGGTGVGEGGGGEGGGGEGDGGGGEGGGVDGEQQLGRMPTPGISQMPAPPVMTEGMHAGAAVPPPAGVWQSLGRAAGAVPNVSAV